MLLLSPTPLPWEEENIAPCSIPTRKINGSHLKDISREKSVLTKNAAEELAALKSCLYDSKSPNVGSLTKPAAKRLKGRIFLWNQYQKWYLNSVPIFSSRYSLLQSLVLVFASFIGYEMCCLVGLQNKRHYWRLPFTKARNHMESKEIHPPWLKNWSLPSLPWKRSFSYNISIPCPPPQADKDANIKRYRQCWEGKRRGGGPAAQDINPPSFSAVCYSQLTFMKHCIGWFVSSHRLLGQMLVALSEALHLRKTGVQGHRGMRWIFWHIQVGGSPQLLFNH